MISSPKVDFAEYHWIRWICHLLHHIIATSGYDNLHHITLIIKLWWYLYWYESYRHTHTEIYIYNHLYIPIFYSDYIIYHYSLHLTKYPRFFLISFQLALAAPGPLKLYADAAVELRERLAAAEAELAELAELRAKAASEGGAGFLVGKTVGKTWKLINGISKEVGTQFLP